MAGSKLWFGIVVVVASAGCIVPVGGGYGGDVYAPGPDFFCSAAALTGAMTCMLTVSAELPAARWRTAAADMVDGDKPHNPLEPKQT